jgi:hypothetical protein
MFTNISRTNLFHWHAADVHHVTDCQRRSWAFSNTPRSERKVEMFFEVVVPAQGLFFGPIGVNDDLHLQPLVEIVVMLSPRHLRFVFAL